MTSPADNEPSPPSQPADAATDGTQVGAPPPDAATAPGDSGTAPRTNGSAKPGQRTGGPGIPPPADPALLAALEADLASARDEAARNRDSWMRALADLDNYRKRAARERDDSRQAAVARLLEDLIPAFDALLLARASVSGSEASGLADGIDLVLQRFRSALAQNGLQELAPAPGDGFNPHEHESLTHQHSPEVPADRVLSLFRSGFRLGNRIIRPASVILSSGPAAS